MHAAVVIGPDTIERREVPDPEPAPGELLVAVQSAGIGFVDVMAARGDYAYFPGPGSVPGLEIVGEVIAVGDGVASSRVGERVLALPRFGGFAELATVPADRAYAVPDTASTSELISLGLNAIVAAAAVQRARIRSGERVLIRGAGGGIGLHLVQLARRRGADVTAVTSSNERAGALAELGATRTLDRDAAAAADDPLDVVIDTAAGPQVATFLRRLAVDGRYVLCGGAAGAPGPDVLEAFMATYHRSPTLTAVSLNSATDDEVREYWHDVLTAFGAGELMPVHARSMSLAEAAEALEVVARRPPFGKVALDLTLDTA